jgi:peptidoglycan/LPS O-acetylase OafA/YrhL
MQQRHLELIHAARGAAALVVVVLHIGVWERLIGVPKPVFAWVESFGAGAVDLFFVLSGFVMTWAYPQPIRRPAALLEFLFARLWRILPLYWVAFPLAILQVRWLYDPIPGTSSYLLGWFFLIPQAVPNVYLPVAWTLPHELTFYLMFALLLPLPSRWRCLAVGLASLVNCVLQSGFLEDPSTWHPVWQLVGNPLLGEFALGMLAAELVRSRVRVPVRGLFFLGFAWMAFWLAQAAFNGTLAAWKAEPSLRLVGFGLGAFAIVLGLAASEVQGRLRAPQFLLRAGDASYSIYLIHLPVCSTLFGLTLRHWPHHMLPHLAWVAAMLVLGIASGWLLHIAVERPLLKFRKRITRSIRAVVRRGKRVHPHGESRRGLRAAGEPCAVSSAHP